MALTQLQIKNSKPGMHSDGNGLYLRVQDSGSKGWIFRFQLNGKRREMGIGTLADKSLADARADAAELGKQVRQGIDPIEQRKASQEAQQQAAEVAKVKSVTFADAVTQYIAGRKEGWKNPKHHAQWQATLDTYATFGGKPVVEITIDDLEQALRPIWLEKTETATRVLSRVICVMAYAQDKGWCSDDAETWSNRLRRRLPMLPKKDNRVQHHPALPYDQLPAFMADLRSKSSIGTRALEFAILCASRSGEVRLAKWSEVDLDAGLWAIPADRMKMQREHRVPLSVQAVELLRALPAGEPDDFVFPGEKKGRPLSDMTLSAAVRRRNEKEIKWKDAGGEPIVPHGFRSTFADWASETTPFPSDVREMALAHVVANKVEAAYRRGDLFEKRRQLMQAWADFADIKPANVIDIRPTKSA